MVRYVAWGCKIKLRKATNLTEYLLPCSYHTCHICTHKLIQILINQNEMNNKFICAFSLAPPIKRFCLFVAGVSALWGKMFLEISDIFHAPAAL